MPLPSTGYGVGQMAVRRMPLPARAAFSTTTSHHASLPPQASSYIQLAEVPQSSEVKPPRIRGLLPVPRPIFRGAKGSRKVQPEYLAKTAPPRTRERELVQDSQQWKKTMAESRRQNLEQGLRGLWDRHTTAEKRRATRARDRQLSVQRAREAPELWSERMSRATVPDIDCALRPDPERFARAEKSRANVAEREAARRETRRDALTELYIHATNFIVTEDQLLAEVDKTFADDYFQSLNNKLGRPGHTHNIWGAYGKPTTINNMFQSQGQPASRLSETLMDRFDTGGHANQFENDQALSRTQRVSEELSGGKLMTD